MAQRLVDRQPQPVSGTALVARLVPPPQFSKVRLDSFRPDPAHPSQAVALTRVHEYADALRGHSLTPPRRGLMRRGRGAPARRGVYLDGGFGVGKTHLLASLWHAAPGPKSYATFVELTHLVGAVGFARSAAELADHHLLCVDEFELDDPGDTVLVSSLLTRLIESGVAVCVTSNTLPEALGEGRFAAADFLREIQALAARFDVVTIDGEDYRHRGSPVAPAPATSADVDGLAGRDDVAVDDFASLLGHLATIHPSRYGDLLDGVTTLAWRDVVTVDDQAAALRLVVLTDRAYDRGIRVVATGARLDALFAADILAGGYRKKYLRALSRLAALAQPVAAARLPAPVPSPQEPAEHGHERRGDEHLDGERR